MTSLGRRRTAADIHMGWMAVAVHGAETGWNYGGRRWLKYFEKELTEHTGRSSSSSAGAYDSRVYMEGALVPGPAQHLLCVFDERRSTASQHGSQKPSEILKQVPSLDVHHNDLLHQPQRWVR